MIDFWVVCFFSFNSVIRQNRSLKIQKYRILGILNNWVVKNLIKYALLAHFNINSSCIRPMIKFGNISWRIWSLIDISPKISLWAESDWNAFVFYKELCKKEYWSNVWLHGEIDRKSENGLRILI